MRTILIATRSTREDVSVAAVTAQLRDRGARVFAFDTASFPGPIRLSVGDEGSVLETEQDRLDLATVDAAWMRHIDVGSLATEAVPEEFRDAVMSQANTAVWSALATVPGLWVDHPSRLGAVPESVAQLHLARRCGLTPPRTLMSNDPERIRAFAASCADGAIFKLLQSSSFQLVDEAGETSHVPTQVLEPEHLLDADRLRVCPMLYQERVPKALELRVTAVGQRLFVAALDTRANPEVIDWRHIPERVGAFRAYDGLDSAVEAGIHRLLSTLGLQFATVDLIVTPAGRTVFLELNTVSYFDWVERAAGLPISTAMADLLMGEAPPRVSAR